MLQIGEMYVMIGHTSAVFKASLWSIHSGLLWLTYGYSMFSIRRVYEMYFGSLFSSPTHCLLAGVSFSI